MIKLNKPKDYYRYTKLSLVVAALPNSGTYKGVGRGFNIYLWNLRGLKDGFDMLGYKALAWAYRNRLINDYTWTRDLDAIWRAWGHDTPKWLRTRAHRRSCLARQIMDSTSRPVRLIEPAAQIINYSAWRDQ